MNDLGVHCILDCTVLTQPSGRSDACHVCGCGVVKLPFSSSEKLPLFPVLEVPLLFFRCCFAAAVLRHNRTRGYNQQDRNHNITYSVRLS